MNDRFVEDVKSRVDLIEIVRKYAEVKKAGKNFVCRSPFRNEKTPSFSISPDKQMWYDFGAAEGGDVISFIEKIENCSFREAVEILADLAGVPIPKDFTANKESSKNNKQDLFSLHKSAAEFFAITLQKTKKAKEYVQSRGLTEAMVKRWQLGYGGDIKDVLTQYLLKQGFKEKLIAESGVAFERTFGDQAMMDRFWGRLIIPICEPRNGEIIAFSGRDILNREKVGKYVNSPENPVYYKSATLFGLDRARQSIKELDAVILVEGNLDVIFAHERGFTNTVATCGTALTDEHLRALRRLTNNFYLAFDSDLAGKKATLKGVEMCLEMELNPYVIALDEVKDFGDFLIKEENAIVLQKIIKECPSALDLFFERFATKNLPQGLEGEKKFLDSFFFFLKLVQRPIEKDEYLKRLAQKLNRSQSIIEDEFNKFTAKQSNFTKPKFIPEAKIHFSREQNFVGFLSAFWDELQGAIKPKITDILKLLADPNTHSILEKKISETKLNKEENQLALAWQMWQEKQFETIEPDPMVLKITLQEYVINLKKEFEKRERTAAAKAMNK